MAGSADDDPAVMETTPQHTLTKMSPATTGVVSTMPPTVGRFEIQSRLGAGGMGMVLLAIDPLLGRKVAIKLVRFAPDDAAAQRRLVREAQALAQVSHEHVIVVHDVGMHDGQVYFAMEYVPGGTLTRWQAERGWREIVDQYIRAGRGLQAAHDAGLVHRDFKPDNVLVGDDGRLRVTDFGLVGVEVMRSPSVASELGTTLTQTGARMGTPRYMAPEQYLGTDVDARADQFAFCVALYEVLYGQRPFSGDNYAELEASVLAGAVRPLPPDADVPTGVRDAVLRGLRREPDDRFPTMRELLAALEAGGRQARASARRRWPGIASAVAGVLVVGIVAYVATRTPATSPAEPASALSAEQIAEGKTHYAKAEAAIQREDYEAAAASFERAYVHLPKPEFLFNAAQTWHALAKQTATPELAIERRRNAVRLYRRYLQEAPNAKDRVAVEQWIDRLERQLATPAPSAP